MRTVLRILIGYIFCIWLASCSKYLEAKPDMSLSTISSLGDVQALLDDYSKLYSTGPSAGEVAGDNYYDNESTWSLLSDYQRNMYLWEDNCFNPTTNDWMDIYFRIYTCNTVLDALQRIDRTDANAGQWDDIAGQAYYYRGRGLLSGAAIWCKVYDTATADKDLGMVLRTDPDFNKISARASVKQTYSMIIGDLENPCLLLPQNVVHNIRPNKGAAYAMLARCYLAMGSFPLTKLYADSALQQNSYLMDYNDPSIIPNPSAAYPMPAFNGEIYNAEQYSSGQVLVTRARIDSFLYASYNLSDLRRTLFFKANSDGTFSFKGNYTGSSPLSSAITTAEAYLMRAEASVRLGDTTTAYNDLNKLLLHRWKTGSFTGLHGLPNNKALLDSILSERRKELLMRGVRWMDIKRLNKDGYNINLKRIINGISYELPANSLRFQLTIPEDVVSMAPSIIQNPR